MSLKKMMSRKSLMAISLSIALTIELTGFSAPFVSGTSKIAKAAETTPYSWNNTIPVKTPLAGAKNNGKVVLFDNAHDNAAGQADWVIDGGFSDFADALVNQGYTVKEYRGMDKNNDGAIRFYDDRNLTADQEGTSADKNEAIITYDAIKDADVFVTAEANRPFRKSEYDALKKFVDSGKGVYFIGDHYNGDRNLNTWDSTEVYNGYNRCDSIGYNMGGIYGDLRNTKDASKGWLSENFGLRFRFNAGDSNPLNSGQTGPTDIRPASETEGLTEGVVGEKILVAAGATIAITDSNKAKGIIYFKDSDDLVPWSSGVENSHGGKSIYFGGQKEGAFVAISKPSKGRAAFIGDSSPIEDKTPKYKNATSGSSKSTYNGWNDLGNAAKLSVNIVNWLADSSQDYVGFGTSSHPSDVYGTTYAPMADVEKSDPDNGQPWSNPSNGFDPWNTDTWKPGSYGAPYSTTPTTDPNQYTFNLALYPSYVYKNEPFAITIGGVGANPSIGMYLTGGTQVGQVYDKASKTWSTSTYTTVSGNAPLTLTTRAVNTGSDNVINIRLRNGKTNTDTKTATTLTSGYGYIEGTVDGAPGSLVTANLNGSILGTAQLDDSNHVKIAVKSGTGITLSIYNSNGTKKVDLPNQYTVEDGKTTPLITVIPKSSNADLSSLTVNTNDTSTSAISPEFSSSILNYNATVDYSVTSVSITPVVSDKKASVTVNGTSLEDGKATLSDLAVGDNLNTISVTAEDGTTRGYTLNIKRDICHPTKVELNTTTLELKQGETSNISATVTPDEAQNKSVRWISSDTSIVSVDDSGKIIAVNAGEATITATTVDNNVSASCTIRVIPKSSNSNLSSLTLQTSDSSIITLSPSFEADKLNYTAAVSYSTSSIVVAPVTADKTARVSINGAALLTDKLTIPNLSVGDNLIRISVTAEDGTIKAYTVNIKREVCHPTKVQLNSTSMQLRKKDTFTLIATVTPVEAVNKTVTWSSSNPSVATVDQNGKVTALSKGDTTITVTTVDGLYTATCEVKVSQKQITLKDIISGIFDFLKDIFCP
ncbi:cadherin-like beta sandwich domain-containing protein [Clostridium sp. YIM B02505]|uniref:Cadherin-like beta sandwich domain-containing protein n=1 Tax=Clostridium yunnanense TaxID=2800325 RepID=A0ABS1EIC1_9CLOT|nr:cadherin-like beta sandwich domain-containing protein [Clostridium yunnanense]MBK1809106.1 cadherin-like beta sandwich domain-containing protein [Clostridium yunnanense]